MSYQILTFSLLLIFLSPTAKAQNVETEAIEKTILQFSKAADEQSVKDLEAVLDENYRVVMNRLFGSTTATVLTKNAYLNKIRNKEFGGDKRTVNIENILINGETASVKATFKGEKMTFVSIMTLIKNADGQWLLVSDLPTVIK